MLKVDDVNAIDVYDDGICRNISKHLKRKGVEVKSKEGRVRKSKGSMGWEVEFPQGMAKVDYSTWQREWFVVKWQQNEDK